MQKRTNRQKRSSCIGYGAQFSYNRKSLGSVAAIYRVVFNTGYFYIGGTKNIVKRASCFSGSFKNGLHLSKKFKEAVVDSLTATIEVLKFISDDEDLIAAESEYIMAQVGNPRMINRAKTGFSNAGISWSQEERKKVSKRMTGMVRPESTRQKHRERVRTGNTRKGCTQSPEHVKNRISAAMKTKKAKKEKSAWPVL